MRRNSTISKTKLGEVAG